jgi:magnesium-transporting ATPase (P-type)
MINESKHTELKISINMIILLLIMVVAFGAISHFMNFILTYNLYEFIYSILLFIACKLFFDVAWSEL